jgi:hypothetical protein
VSRAYPGARYLLSNATFWAIQSQVQSYDSKEQREWGSYPVHQHPNRNDRHDYIDNITMRVGIYITDLKSRGYSPS